MNSHASILRNLRIEKGQDQGQEQERVRRVPTATDLCRFQIINKLYKYVPTFCRNASRCRPRLRVLLHVLSLPTRRWALWFQTKNERRAWECVSSQKAAFSRAGATLIRHDDSQYHKYLYCVLIYGRDGDVLTHIWYYCTTLAFVLYTIPVFSLYRHIRITLVT
jgi:hypothetical protein